MKLLIFGLTRDVSQSQVRLLLASACNANLAQAAEVAVVDVQDDLQDEGQGAFAVVQLQLDRLQASRLAYRLSQKRLGGRLLQSWVPAMNWS